MRERAANTMKINCKIYLGKGTKLYSERAQVLMRIGGQPVVGAFRERVSAKPGEILPVMPDPALIHLFDQQTGHRL